MITDDRMKTVHHISENEVQAAEQLAVNGEQRLRTVSPLDSTHFHFPVSCGDDFASVVIEVSPVYQDASRHPSYIVAARYATCYDVANASEQTDEILRVIQLIYDTYIQAIRWTFGEDCLKRRFTHDHAECTVQKAIYLDRLKSGFDNDPCAESCAASVSNASPPPSSTDASPSPQSRAESDTDEHYSNGQDDETDIDARKSHVLRSEHRDTQSEASLAQHGPCEKDQLLADALIAKAKTGLKRMQKHGDRRFRFSNIQALLSEDMGNEEIDELLSKLEEEWWEKSRNTRVQLRAEAWMSWFFSASLRFALDTRRRYKLSRRAKAVSILYCTLNQLLITDGIEAISLLFAYAYTNHYMAEAASTSEVRRWQISHLVAAGLHGELSRPGSNFFVPIPVVWVAVVTKCSYLEACNMLGAPHLALLQLEPEWVCTEDQQYHLVHEIRYSELSCRWALFLRSTANQPDASSLMDASTKTSGSGYDPLQHLDPVPEAIFEQCHSFSKKRHHEADNNAEHVRSESFIMDSQKRQHQADGSVTDFSLIGTQQLSPDVGYADTPAIDPVLTSTRPPDPPDLFNFQLWDDGFEIVPDLEGLGELERSEC